MALKGKTKKTLRQDSKGKLYLSVAIPIKNIRMVRGAVLLSISGKKIEFLELFDPADGNPSGILHRLRMYSGGVRRESVGNFARVTK